MNEDLGQDQEISSVADLHKLEEEGETAAYVDVCAWSCWITCWITSSSD